MEGVARTCCRTRNTKVRNMTSLGESLSSKFNALTQYPLEFFGICMALESPCRKSCWQSTKKSTHGKYLVRTSRVFSSIRVTRSIPVRGSWLKDEILILNSFKTGSIEALGTVLSDDEVVVSSSCAELE